MPFSIENILVLGSNDKGKKDGIKASEKWKQ